MVTPLVQIQDFSWRYSVGTWVLNGINLTIFPGERVGLVGRSGSGKSTLVLALNGIIPQSLAGEMTGQVVVAGSDVTTTSVSEMAQKVAMVFQSPDDQMSHILVCHELASGPANLCLPSDEITKRVERVSRELHIEHLLQRETATLSGGEKQKVALGAALAMEPHLLVLDEPTTDLDPVNKEEVIRILRSTDGGMAILVVSHDLEAIAPLVNRLVVMAEGAIVADGATSDILSQRELLHGCGVARPQLVTFNHSMHEKFPDWPIHARHEEIVARLDHSARPYVPVQRANTKGEPIVALYDVTFQYPRTEQTTVVDVSLSVAQGEIVAIVGNNGSGKTTISKLIMGLLKPQSGTITVMGQRVERVRPDLIGYIYQNPDAMLSQMTVGEEVAFTPKILRASNWQEVTEQMLSQFSLQTLASRFPLALSKGQRQRLAYAAVTAAQPPVLIFDEPTTGIDQPGCDEIMHYMDALRRMGKTILFITHDMALAMKWADRIVVVQQGRVMHDGAPETLMVVPAERLAAYHLRLPPICELAQRLGLVATTPEDFAIQMKEGVR